MPPKDDDKKIEYKFCVERFANAIPLFCEKISPWEHSGFLRLENTYYQIENERTGRTAPLKYKELYINANQIMQIKPLDPPWTAD